MIPLTIAMSDEKLARRLGMLPFHETPLVPCFLVYCGNKPFLWPLDERLVREINKRGTA